MQELPDFVVDLALMVQINQSNGFVRPVRRVYFHRERKRERERESEEVREKEEMREREREIEKDCVLFQILNIFVSLDL